MRLQVRHPYHFASQQMLVPVMASEMAQISREYAVVFSDVPATLPLALLGARRGENAYVRPSGHWAARYVPAHIRRYPFVLAAHAPTEGSNGSAERRMVMVDADAPQLVFEGGLALFESDGAPSALLKRVQEMLVMLERDSDRTLALMDQIEAAGLLVERVVELPQRQGQTLGLRGLRVIDAERLGALDPAALDALQQSGALHLVYAQLLSMSNLRDGPLVEGVAAAADAEAAGASNGANSSGSISFDGIDWTKF